MHITIPSTSEMSKLIAASEKEYKKRLGTMNFRFCPFDDIKLRILGLYIIKT